MTTDEILSRAGLDELEVRQQGQYPRFVVEGDKLFLKLLVGQKDVTLCEVPYARALVMNMDLARGLARIVPR